MSDEHEHRASSFKLGDRAAEKKAVEDWAEQKGMLPEKFEVQGGARLGQHRVPAVRQNPKFIFFVQAKALRSWPVGREVTEEEFDSAVAEAQGVAAR
jgi:hypothetical protein